MAQNIPTSFMDGLVARMAAMRNRESQLIQDLSARACFDRSSVRSETYSLLGLVSLSLLNSGDHIVFESGFPLYV